MSKVISYRFRAINKSKYGHSGFRIPLESEPNKSPEFNLILAYAHALRVLGFELDDLVDITLDK